jgi:hypothetical protein
MINDRPYPVEETPDGRTLDVRGPWSAAVADVVRRGEADVLVLNHAHGFSETDLEFLEDDLGVRRLMVLDRRLSDLRPIARLGQSLEELSVEAAPGTELDLKLLPQLRILAGEWALIRETLASAAELISLVTWRFNEPDLHAFRDHVALRRLTIKEAAHLESLSGVGELPELEALSLVGAPRLQEIHDVRGVASSLERLELQGCRALRAIDDLDGLINLRWLGLNDCRDLESLAPVRSLAHLEVLHAWGSTRVADGDLSSLAELPRLREIRMRDRIEYKPRLAELVARLPI